MSFVVVDIETTGLSKHYHRITEIAAARVEGGEITREFHTLINPGTRIPGFITKITGITNAMVADAPMIQHVLPAFLKFLGESVFVGHNATFDHGFLNANASKWYRRQIANPRLCTVKLANRLVPSLSSRKLGVVCDHFGIVNSQAHRAMSDVHATVEVLNQFLDMLKSRDICCPKEVVRFSNLPRRKCLCVASAGQNPSANLPSPHL